MIFQELQSGWNIIVNFKYINVTLCLFCTIWKIDQILSLFTEILILLLHAESIKQHNNDWYISSFAVCMCTETERVLFSKLALQTCCLMLFVCLKLQLQLGVILFSCLFNITYICQIIWNNLILSCTPRPELHPTWKWSCALQIIKIKAFEFYQ